MQTVTPSRVKPCDEPAVTGSTPKIADREEANISVSLSSADPEASAEIRLGFGYLIEQYTLLAPVFAGSMQVDDRGVEHCLFASQIRQWTNSARLHSHCLRSAYSREAAGLYLMAPAKSPAVLRLQPSSVPVRPPPPSPGLLTPGPSSSRLLPTAIPSKNPIALRLYKVLGANYQDSSTRAALETLSSFYAPNANDPSAVGHERNTEKSRSIGGALDDDEDDEEESWGAEYANKARQMLHVPPDSPPEIDGQLALRARKNLRKDIEAKLADSSRKFLDAFAEVDTVSAL